MGHQRVKLTQPRSSSPSIIRAEFSDKALCLAVARLIPPPSMGEGQGEDGEVFAKNSGSLYDSLANPVNIAAVPIHLLIVIRL
jgi:hypothetical protein